MLNIIYLLLCVAVILIILLICFTTNRLDCTTLFLSFGLATFISWLRTLRTEHMAVEKWTEDHCPLFHSLYNGDDIDPLISNARYIRSVCHSSWISIKTALISCKQAVSFGKMLTTRVRCLTSRLRRSRPLAVRNRRYREQAHEIPGVSPAIITRLLDWALEHQAAKAAAGRRSAGKRSNIIQPGQLSIWSNSKEE